MAYTKVPPASSDAKIHANLLNYWDIPIAKWAEWPTPQQVELPVLDFVDPMLRRRLSSLSKASLWVAHQCAYALSDIRMIYASRHGEIVRTTDMLKALAVAEPLSPTAFSMSVLNTTVGLYSIIRGNYAPATAISAGAETFGYALLEAHGQLISDPDRPVLLIYAEEAVPDIWQNDTEKAPHALALLLDNRATDMRIHCARTSALNLTSSHQTQAKAFLECIVGRDSTWSHKAIEWQWKKVT